MRGLGLLPLHLRPHSLPLLSLPYFEVEVLVLSVRGLGLLPLHLRPQLGQLLLGVAVRLLREVRQLAQGLTARLGHTHMFVVCVLCVRAPTAH